MMNERIIKSDKNRSLLSGNFESKSGLANIYYKKSIPADAGKQRQACHLIVLHDFYDYHERYLSLLEYFESELNLDAYVYLLDSPGFGLSSGRRGYSGSLDYYCQDIAAFIQHQAINQNEKVFVVGQGLGGLFSLYFYQVTLQNLSHKIDGLILSNPLINFKIQLPSWIEILLKQEIFKLNQVKLPWELNVNELTSDQRSIFNFHGDPLCYNYLTFGLHSEIQRLSDFVRKNAYFVDIPNLFLVSSSHSYFKMENLILFQKGLSKKNSSIKTYEEMRYDLFNETDRDKIFTQIKKWLEQQCSL